MALCLTGVLAGCASYDYKPESKAAAVTTPVIHQEGKLVVGVDTNNPPLAGQASKIVGIDIDIAAAIADELGLQLEIVDVGSAPVANLNDGTVDIVMGIDASLNDSAMWKSETYLQTAPVIFALEGADVAMPSAGMAEKIAVQTASLSATLVTNEFGADVLQNESALDVAFNSLKDGLVTYVAADSVIGGYAATTIDGCDVKPIAALQSPTGYSIGVLNSNTDLKVTVQDTLKKLYDSGVISVIEKKWIGFNVDFNALPKTPKAA